ncbi:protein of unknown function [Taphrina deformans PYCC 5710]|uniref:B30.2/SPRY domain-containing protein n=1 Tax=Taphrina deformans (strain PYCC 5710 / ATCC 11124 / CBS 356.35 / IMI 108563 / JCM 9778 / NBRC 8474) TaxID=1097556 RepID=R4XDK7_TAPDE|nr:protein of unknown function [Taphrina deformans PYCC 5710]|eukprot:CCG83961.1 protein of unknown function [Taphrina deformans PYCC 5710]
MRLIVPLFSTMGGLLLCLLLLFVFYYLRFYRHGRIMLGSGLPGSFDDEQQAIRDEEMYLHTLDESARQAYFRAKGRGPLKYGFLKSRTDWLAYQESSPPDSTNTEISLSQFLSIQEKGVSAWEFEPDLETTNCIVEYRTEMTFYDTECSVQTNLPLPKQNDMYYWEAKLHELPANTMVAIGLATKPYPAFRLPGFNKYSVAYLSDGTRRRSQPFFGKGYGPVGRQGDVIGCGYKPRTGTVFFTRNGKRLEEAATNLKKSIFPTVGANGPCSVHINFGQAGFVFIEANVKKWGLAPMNGTLLPPPAYGSSELGDSVLLAAGFNGNASLTQGEDSSSAGIVPDVSSPMTPGPPYLPSDISLTNLSHRQSGMPQIPGIHAPPDYSSDASSVLDDGAPGPSGAQQPLLSPDEEETRRFDRM